MYQTSSPSYVLSASIMQAISWGMEHPEEIRAYARRVRELRKAARGWKRLRLLETGARRAVACASFRSDISVPGSVPVCHPVGDSFKTGNCERQTADPCTWLYDPGKLLIWDGSGTLSGEQLHQILRKRFRLQPEMHGDWHVLLMTSPADTKEGFARLTAALAQLDAELEEAQAYPFHVRYESGQKQGFGARFHPECEIGRAHV